MSEGKSFGEILKKFKENESPTSISCLIDDSKLRHGLAAWKSVSITISTPGECTETTPLGQWNWLWKHAKPDLETFAVVSGVLTYEAQKLFDRLKGLRLVYPDGTISTLAEQYVYTMIAAAIPKKRKKDSGEVK